MDKKIKKTFTKIIISIFALGGFLVAFFPKIIWNNSLNLKEIENGSQKIWKSFSSVINTAEADTVASCGDGDSSVSSCAGNTDSDGDAGCTGSGSDGSDGSDGADGGGCGGAGCSD